MKSPFFASMVVASALVLGACKSKAESKADEYLEAGKFRNALRLYMKVEESGKQSETFKDNYALALTRSMAKAAKSDPTQTVINTYVETIPKYLEESQNQAIVTEYVKTIADVGSKKIGEGVYSETVDGFKFIKMGQDFAAKTGHGASEAETIYKNVAQKYLAEALSNADGSSDPVAQEYYLLEAKKVLGLEKYPTLSAKLDEVRKKNRGNFLIWAPDINGIKPSRLIDVNGFVFAFRAGAVKASSTSLGGHLQIWNTSGNNTEIKKEEIFLVAVDGKTVSSNSKVSKGCGVRFDSEKDCTTGISFKFEKGFEPHHVLIKNSDGEGRKFLGK